MDIDKAKCKTCKHVFFYDWYICEEGMHCDDEGFIHTEVKECSKYEKV